MNMTTWEKEFHCLPVVRERKFYILTTKYNYSIVIYLWKETKYHAKWICACKLYLKTSQQSSGKNNLSLSVLHSFMPSQYREDPRKSSPRNSPQWSVFLLYDENFSFRQICFHPVFCHYYHEMTKTPMQYCCRHSWLHSCFFHCFCYHTFPYDMPPSRDTPPFRQRTWRDSKDGVCKTRRPWCYIDWWRRFRSSWDRWTTFGGGRRIGRVGCSPLRACIRPDEGKRFERWIKMSNEQFSKFEIHL